MSISEPPYHCRFCGAVWEEDEWVCWHCDTPFEEISEADTAEPLPLAPSGATSRGSYSLASLLLLTTFVSVTLGAFAVSPLVGLPTIALLAVTGMRTVRAVNLRKSHGVLVTGGQVASLLFRAILTTLLLLAFLVVIVWASAIGGSLVYSLAFTLGHYLGFTRPLLQVVGSVSGWVVGFWIFLRGVYWLIWIRRDMFATDPYDWSK